MTIDTIDFQKIKEKDTLTIAKLMTAIENDSPIVEELLDYLLENHQDTSHVPVIGITGPPGSGKSTLVDQLIKEYRALGKTVGIIAIDPTSPFSKGAVLGDRVRMQRHSTDDGVFIRSMATRKTKGGLANGVRNAIKLLEAAQKDIIIVETVGVGQVETDVVKITDSVIVTTVPGLGDSMQSFKAGLMEIGDIFVVNMADRPGADKTVSQLQMSLNVINARKEWKPKVVKTIALEGGGVTELISTVEEHYHYLVESGKLEEQRMYHVKDEITERVEKKIANSLYEEMERNDTGLLIQEVYNGKRKLHEAIQTIYNQFRNLNEPNRR